MAQNKAKSEFQGNSSAGTGEDFGNMLAEVRAYGEAIIIAEQIPSDLVKGAIGNTFIKLCIGLRMHLVLICFHRLPT